MNDFPTFDSVAATPQRELLESEIQEACIRYARGRGWWARKFASPANRSVPDYILGKLGFTVFVEFKRPGKSPTKAQAEEHKLMAEAGLMVHVIDSVAKFKQSMGEWEREFQAMWSSQR
jgi:hypothetical protein